jgi:ABC-type nickel/cobalt efflux system permease component RcnA
MHIVWGTACIAVVVIAVGVALIVARGPIARFSAYRQQKYYPSGMKQVFGVQSRPGYYVVLGTVITIIGVIVGLSSLRR